VRQVGHLPELYRDARPTEHKKWSTVLQFWYFSIECLKARYYSPGLFNVLGIAASSGKIWSACGQHEILHTE
jgi:hypothetical protein